MATEHTVVTESIPQYRAWVTNQPFREVSSMLGNIVEPIIGAKTLALGATQNNVSADEREILLRGGASIRVFSDPDGNAVIVASPGQAANKVLSKLDLPLAGIAQDNFLSQ